MKAAPLTTAANPAKKNTPFFSKETEPDFFHSLINEQPFFSKSKTNSSFPIQTKLTIGRPNDVYEKQADSMADKVVQRLAEPDIQTKSFSSNGSITSFVQKKCMHCEEEERKEKEKKPAVNEQIRRKPIFESNAERERDSLSAGQGEVLHRKCAECEKEEKLQKKEDSSSLNSGGQIESRLNATKGNGFPLPTQTRTQMERSFGADFSGVRIHNNSSAAHLSKDLNAHAFTHGSDIYFNSGKYDTGSKSGQHLLAHELTHVVQQGGPSVRKKAVTENQNKYLHTAHPQVQRHWYNVSIPFTDYEFDPSIEGVKTAAGLVKDKVVEGAEWIFDKIKGLLNDGKKWLIEKWNRLKEYALSAWEDLKNTFSNILNLFKEPFKIIANAIVNFDFDTLKTVWQTFSLAITTTLQTFRKVTDKLIGVVRDIWGGIDSFVSSLFDEVNSLTQNFVFRHLPDGLQSIIRDFIEEIRKLWRNISDTWNGILNTIQSWIDSALQTIEQFVKRVTSFAINVIIEGLKEFGEIVLFLKDLFANPQKYLEILAKKSVVVFDGLENRFGMLVQQYFPSGKEVASGISGVVQRKPIDQSETKTSASWTQIGKGVWAMMGLKWQEFKKNPWQIVTNLLLDMFLPIVGNVKDVIKLGKDIWKVVTGPLSAGSLEEFWTSLLLLLDIPIMIYNTIVNILMRTLALPLIVATFVPHPLVKAIAAAVGEGLLGAFVEAELLNIGQKILLLKTGKTNSAQKTEAYNRIADSLIAFAMAGAIFLIMLILNFLANIAKGIYNFIKGKVFSIETPVAEGKLGETEGKGKQEIKGMDEVPDVKDKLPSADGKRQIKVTDSGKIWVCASPCDELRFKYEGEIKDNPQLDERIKALEDGYGDLSPEERNVRDAQIKQLEQELADSKAAKETNIPSNAKPKEVTVGEELTVPYGKGNVRAKIVEVNDDFVKVQFDAKAKGQGAVTQSIPRERFNQMVRDGDIIRWTDERARLMRTRPEYEPGLVDKVWEKSKQPDGKVYDPHNKKELKWDKSKNRDDQWHMGHKPGKEYVKLVDEYTNGRISYDEFLKEYNNADNYWAEDPVENLSHQHEAD